MSTRRHFLSGAAALTGAGLLPGMGAAGEVNNEELRKAIRRGLDWVAQSQMRSGYWDAQGQYRVPMTALAGAALLGDGSTTMQGPYSLAIQRATDYLISQTRSNGLIGDPKDYRYTYGHGFSMLFLSQVLGEEEDVPRREKLIEVLTKAVEFTGAAQTKAGGWGYVSAKDGGDFDEGSTTITQVQGLRGCRNAGIAVPKEIIDKAIGYIQECTGPDGGVYYSSKSRGAGRPPITAAAVACLFNAGEYANPYVLKLLNYCKQHLSNVADPRGSFGHWHYTYYYYSQVMYRLGDQEWGEFREKIFPRIMKEQQSDGSWTGNIGPIYVTASNLTILLLEKGFLPIYQR